MDKGKVFSTHQIEDLGTSMLGIMDVKIDSLKMSEDGIRSVSQLTSAPIEKP